MDQSRKRKFSPVWDHFDLITENKVKCRICSQELSRINRSTSTMLRHYRARHEKEEQVNSPVINTGASRKQAIDEAIVNMIIKDCQPLSLVEDEGFKELLQLLEPSYVLPSRQPIKTMINR
uniref:BED-type domain-containing protein n=1 Tax=Tetraodon nigroviridis TaxID=99883 RepID=H3CCS6_TETNG